MTNLVMDDCPQSNGSSNHKSKERFAQFIDNSCCTRYCLGPNPSLARFIYALIFLVTCLLAWSIRDYGHNALSELERLKVCHGARACLGAEGVLRISFGCFLFFFLMFLSTVGTKKLEDTRNNWHSEWWPVKIVLWIGFMVIPFFIPSAFVQLYGKIAHFGAGAFLLIQLISVISFINWLNDRCRSEKYFERCQYQIMALSVTTYLASIIGITMMYIWYVPNVSCKFNILFITSTLVLLQLMTLASIPSKVRGGFLAPGLMGLYIVYLCWSAIRSEPQTEICNKKAEAATSADWLTIVSFVIAVLAIVIATFSTGIDSKCLQVQLTYVFKKTEAESEDEVPYGYGFFHFVFAMGAMYFAMLFVGWNSKNTMPKWTIDVGWTSTWVRIVNEWVATLVYFWMLIAPLFWKSKTEADPV
ncbi:probable serine incorporator isoform X1 [Zingiber officinale]|uniref:probable serine incorporator isoform X1 n=1 Tax=Zingiber officinale TaxID=94328 RepID=UPI001C4AA1C3|nr:probable serine incorporator isoform X1 [Zingiber officinale]XP_042398430.1 probable serine incorporator isoform X1 [Zingiber officinale]